MTDPPTTDLRREALREIKAQFQKKLGELEDHELAKIVTDEFVLNLFDAAWRYQFQENPIFFKKEVRRLINATVGSHDAN